MSPWKQRKTRYTSSRSVNYIFIHIRVCVELYDTKYTSITYISFQLPPYTLQIRNTPMCIRCVHTRRHMFLLRWDVSSCFVYNKVFRVDLAPLLGSKPAGSILFYSIYWNTRMCTKHLAFSRLLYTICIKKFAYHIRDSQGVAQNCHKATDMSMELRCGARIRWIAPWQ